MHVKQSPISRVLSAETEFVSYFPFILIMDLNHLRFEKLTQKPNFDWATVPLIRAVFELPHEHIENLNNELPEDWPLLVTILKDHVTSKQIKLENLQPKENKMKFSQIVQSQLFNFQVTINDTSYFFGQLLTEKFTRIKEKNALIIKERNAEKHRQKNRHANMSDEQIEKHRKRNRIDNMSNERIELQRAGDRIDNMTNERIELQRDTHRIDNMSNERIEVHQQSNRHANMSDERVESHRAANRQINMRNERIERIRQRRMVLVFLDNIIYF